MNFTEILDKIQRDTNTQNSTTSSYTTASKTLDVNLALNQYFILANSATGNWRPADDTNQIDYPVEYAKVRTNQQDYTFYLDSHGNQIQNIYKVRILNPNGIDWTTLEQINEDTITDDQLSTVNSGIPSQYYLTANGIFLVQKPNYDLDAGLEISMSRTPTYFLATDTTKKAGIPWAHHEYLSLRPSYFYNLLKNPSLASQQLKPLTDMETAIKKFWRDRNKDFSQSITPETINPI